MIPTSQLAAFFTLNATDDALIIHRTAAQDALHQAITNHTIVLIQAPSGFGKTTLIQEYSAKYPSKIQYINIYAASLNDEFWLAFFTAIKKYDYGLGESLTALLSDSAQPNFILDITDKLNKAARSIHHAGDLIIVIDSIENISEALTFIQLNALLAALPHWIRFIFCGQSNPGINTERFLSQGRCKVLSAETLKLDQAGCEKLYQSGHHTQLPHSANQKEMQDNIYRLTGGWAGIINLLSKGDQCSPNQQNTLDIPIGSQTYFFIKNWVLKSIKTNTHDFLASVCMLQEFDLPLLVKLGSVNHLDNMSSEELITQIEICMQHGFIESKPRQTYTVNSIIKSYLHNAYLSSDQNITLYKNRQLAACDYHKKHNNLNAALGLYLELQLWNNASNALLRFSQPLIQKGHFDPIRKFLDQFPKEFLLTQPYLCLLECLFCINRYENQNAKIYLNFVDNYLDSVRQNKADGIQSVDYGVENESDFDVLINTYQILNGLLQRFTPGYMQASTQSKQSSTHLNHIQTGQFLCWQHYGDSVNAFINDDMQSCIKYGYLATAEAKNIHDLNCIISSSGWLYHGLYYNGHVDQAIELAESNLDFLRHAKGLDLANINNVYSALCFLYIEKNNLDKAWFYYDALLSSISEYTEPREILYGQYYMHILLLSASNQTEQLNDAISSLKTYESGLAEKKQYSDQDDFSILFNSDLISHLTHVNNGDTFPLINWALTGDSHTDSNSKFRFRYESFLQLVGQGLSGMDVLDELKSVIEESKQGGVIARYINAALFKASMHMTLNEIEYCKRELEQLLPIAKQAGYIGLLIGTSNNKALFKFALKHNIERDYTESLLQALLDRKNYQHSDMPNIQQPPSSVSDLLFSLTTRERQVLVLLSEGLRNKELSEQLDLTVPTVKRHLQNIYGKLQVGSRTEAVLFCKPYLGIIHPETH